MTQKMKQVNKIYMAFPGGSAGKELACNVGEGKGYPLQYSGLENSMDCIVHGIVKTRTRLSDFHFHMPATWINTQHTVF